MEKELYDFLSRLDRASPVGDMVIALLGPILKGRLKYYSDWDDLRAPASGINPPGAASDPARGEDGTFLFSASTENLVAVLFQMPHSWKIGTEIKPHVHWSKATAQAGDVAWEMRYRVFSEGEAPPAWSAWLPAERRSSENGSTLIHIIDGFPAINMEGQKLSCMVSFQIRRNPAAAKDNYAGQAIMWEFDAHYLSDGFGSFEEYIKGEA